MGKMSEMDKRILITGSKGRIGKILMPALSGVYDMHGLDCVESSENRYTRADLADFDSLKQAYDKLTPFDCVIHLAADSRMDSTWESILHSNIIGTRNLYECSRQHGVKKIIFASTNQVTMAYEKDKKVKKITVTEPVRPVNDYATSKIFGEAIARQYYEKYGIQSLCLRIGTVLENDDPASSRRHMKTWLSHRDMIQLFIRSIEATVSFGIYYGVSNNRERYWDIRNAKQDLKFVPHDDADALVKGRQQ